MDAPAYTLREIARELNLPESTIRYYRDAFALYLPSIGMGRRRRYPAEALELFRVIAESYSQNLNREAIEAKLQEVAPLPAPAQAHTSGMAVRPAFQVQRRSSLSDADNQQLVANIMDGERERREVMWQIAREIGHMGDALERQQRLLGQITERMQLSANRALPAGASAPEPGGADEENSLAKELSALREELQKERELVERLRRSKLEIERRASQAETELLERRERPSQPSVLGRLLGKEEA